MALAGVEMKATFEKLADDIYLVDDVVRQLGYPGTLPNMTLKRRQQWWWWW